MTTLEQNFMLKSDSYKHSHHKMTPPGLEFLYSYLAARGGEHSELVLFGIQIILKRHFEGAIITPEAIEQAKRIVDAHMGPGIFNYDGWMYIANELGGKLPLRIKALPEGTIVVNGEVMMTVENTDKKCAFLTNFCETLLHQVWDPITVASNSREMVRLIKKYLVKTADNCDGLPFKMHDFGFRGCSCWEEAGVAGSAHLVNSKGTDTMAGLIMAIEYYGAEMPGFSLAATEHSVMCAWGRDGEMDGVRNLLEKHLAGIVACVSDTYNIYNACEAYTTVLKDLIMSRDGMFVVRPDSGYPPEVVVKCLDILWNGYRKEGSFVGPNKNYKLLPPQIRMIYGDGIDLKMLAKILEAVTLAGYSTDNLAFGSGGGLLRKVDRDTNKFSFKASSFVIDGKRVDERKDPITDTGKRSKLGRFKVVDDELSGELLTVPEEDPREDRLQTIFLNGDILVNPKWDDVVARAALP